MGSGEVDEAWARQHHSLWLEEVRAKQGGTGVEGAKTPAE
jgi:formate dehydrogenase subunit gamma